MEDSSLCTRPNTHVTDDRQSLLNVGLQDSHSVSSGSSPDLAWPGHWAFCARGPKQRRTRREQRNKVCISLANVQSLDNELDELVSGGTWGLAHPWPQLDDQRCLYTASGQQWGRASRATKGQTYPSNLVLPTWKRWYWDQERSEDHCYSMFLYVHVCTLYFVGEKLSLSLGQILSKGKNKNLLSTDIKMNCKRES